MQHASSMVKEMLAFRSGTQTRTCTNKHSTINRTHRAHPSAVQDTSAMLEPL